MKFLLANFKAANAFDLFGAGSFVIFPVTK